MEFRPRLLLHEAGGVFLLCFVNDLEKRSVLNLSLAIRKLVNLCKSIEL